MGFSRKTYSGQSGVERGERLPMTSTNSPFYFVHSPLAWDFLETQHGWELLPKVNGISHQAGVSGMAMQRGGGVDDTMWYARKTRDENCIVIPMSYEYEGEAGYLSRWINKNGQPFYTDKWTTPQKVGNKVIWNTDDEGFNDFKRHLVHEDVIPMPHEIVIEGLKQRLIRRIEKRVNAAAMNADIKAKKEAYEQQLALIDVAYQNLLAKKLPSKSKKKGVA